MGKFIAGMFVGAAAMAYANSKFTFEKEISTGKVTIKVKAKQAADTPAE